MDVGLQKTTVFLFFILIGIVLKVKFKSKDELTGIKKIILNLALPATIFIALLSIDIRPQLFLLPLLALGLNLLLFLLMPFFLPLLGISKKSSEYRTARLLVPSLAPGLSCFPFILEFLGESYLAKAAMADLGNKFFVLIVLYLVAMGWYYNLQSRQTEKEIPKIGALFKAMLSEPVNIFIAVALLLLGFGITMDSLPFFINETLEKLSLIMTPLVLLFIGLAVKIKKKQFFKILSLLLLRAGLVLLISAGFIMVLGVNEVKSILLALAFGLSACSFWPYAHIAVVDGLEDTKKAKNKTFNSNFGIAILALSFPLSTLLILGVLNSGALFGSAQNIFFAASLLIVLGLLYPILLGIGKKIVEYRQVRPELKSASENL